MYIDIWDPKPPAVIETTAVLSVISRGNPHVHHGLSILVTTSAIVVSALLISHIVEDITGNAVSGLLSGLIFISFPLVLVSPFSGFGSKPLTIMFGLLAVSSARSKRPALAGAAAVVSTAYWQFSLIFVVLCLVILSNRHYKRFVGGGFITGAIILAPIVYWGALVPMIVEAIIAPMSGGEVQSFLYRLVKGVLMLGWSIPICIIGVVGIYSYVRNETGDRGWLIIFCAWFALQIFVLDYDGPDDLMYGFVLISMGIGLLYGRDLMPNLKRVLAAFVVTMVLFNTLTLGGVGIVDHSDVQDSQDPSALLPQFVLWASHQAGYSEFQIGGSSPDDLYEVRSPYGPEKVKELFWSRTTPTSCHYRLSGLELAWINKTSDTYIQDTCGALPERYTLENLAY